MNALEAYERACNKLVTEFVEVYYYGSGWGWVGDTIGGVLVVGDEFHDITAIAETMRLRPSESEFFEFYYYRLDCHEHKKSPLKMSAWLVLEREEVAEKKV